MGQLANHLGERDKGKLLSQPVTNSKAFTIGNSASQVHGHEQVQSIITLRSMRQVDNKVFQEEETWLYCKVKRMAKIRGKS